MSEKEAVLPVGANALSGPIPAGIPPVAAPAPKAEPSVADLMAAIAQQNQLILGLLSKKEETKADDPNNILAKVMLAREQRLIADDERKAENRARREAKSVEDNAVMAREIEEGYATCPHLKGGRRGEHRGNMPRDYNFSHHTFPDASKQIRCNSCGCTWRPGDTKEFRYIPNGARFERRVNLTGKSFEDVLSLFVNESTNKPTSSEISGAVVTRNIMRQLKEQVAKERTPEQTVMLDAPPAR
jgi:hypothetical protein